MRDALRFLRKSPGFAAVAIAILALGIGANVAVFSVIHAVLLAKLPVADPDRLVAFTRHNAAGAPGETFSRALHDDLQQATDAFSGVLLKGGYERVTLELNGAGEPALGELVSGNYFEVLGVRPHLGRLFTREDDLTPGGHPVVVLSHRFWQRQFAADPAIVGRTLHLGGRSMTVVGVSAPGFEGVDPGQAVDLRVPSAMQSVLRDPSSTTTRTPNRTAAEWTLVGRLAPGANLAVAQDKATAVLRHHLASTAPTNNTSNAAPASERIELRPAATGLGRTRAQFESALWMLFGLTAAVLFAACVNLAGMILARTVSRQRELAVRAALGASTSRLARLLLTESLALTILGSLVAVLLARPATSALTSWLASGASNLDLVITPGPTALLHAVGLTVICGAIVALLPVWWSRRDALASALKTTDAATAAGRLGGHLVSAEIAIAVVVLVCAGLFVRTAGALRDLDPGFRSDQLVAIALSPKNAGRDDARALAFFRDLRDRIDALPGVEGASYVQIRGLSGGNFRAPVTIDGAPVNGPQVTATRNVVGPEFFHTFGTSIRAGRDFTAADNGDAPRVAIVNEAFAREHFPGRDPLGLRIGANGADHTIVGIAADTRFFNLRDEPPAIWYIPYEQFPASKYLDLCVRTALPPEAMLGSIRSAIAELDPAVAMFNVRTYAAEADALLAPELTLARLGTVFGLSAAALVAIGLYGLLAFRVQTQRRAIGIRMAVGATPSAVVAHVLSGGLRCALLGLAAGAVLALATTQLAAHLLYGVSALDPIVFGAVLMGLLGVAVVASFVPARRASRVDPLVALRAE